MDLLTIAEYSAIRKCSTTATYKRLETTLRNYVVVKDGKKYIKAEILDIEGLQTELTVANPPLPTVVNRSKPSETVRENENNEAETANDLVGEGKSQLDVMATVVKVLETQTASKDQEIERLHSEIEDLREQLRTANSARDEAERHNREQANKLAVLLEQSQELQRNNQILMAQHQQAIEAPKPEPEEVMEDSQEAHTDEKDAEIEQLRAKIEQLEKAQENTKVGFFSRFFKRG